MLQKIRNLILALSLMFTAAVPLAMPSVASAASQISNNVCQGVNSASGVSSTILTQTGTEGACSNQDTHVNSLLSTIINWFSIIVGVAAVIMIVFAGFKYITSGGKEEGVKTAKNTILYAIIGLVIVGLAQVIVQFVLQKSTSA